MNSTRAATGLMKSPPVRPPESPSMVPDCPGLPPTARAVLDNLIKVQMLDKSQVGLFLQTAADQVAEFGRVEVLANALLQAGLLTPYQADRVLSGSVHGMVLGNYR